MRNVRAVSLVAAALLVAACSGDGADPTTTTAEPEDPTTRAATTTEAEETTTTQAEATTTTGSSGDATITISDFQFTGVSSVSVGTTVTVTNEDGVSHTWTSDDDVWESGTLRQGDTFEFTFDEPGEYTFFCEFHPSIMTGSITVEG